MVATSTVDAADLAAEFLAEIADRPEPWQQLVLPWAADRGVTVEELKTLQREVIRQRIFGAVARHRPRVRKRR
jgi:hypothetical protein